MSETDPFLTADVPDEQKIRYLLDWQARAARTIETLVGERDELRAENERPAECGITKYDWQCIRHLDHPKPHVSVEGVAWWDDNIYREAELCAENERLREALREIEGGSHPLQMVRVASEALQRPGRA